MKDSGPARAEPYSGVGSNPNSQPTPDFVQLAVAYHERTKHHYHRYARSLGYLDWDTQPDPFRRFESAPLIRLPIPTQDTTPPYDRLFRPDAIDPKPVTRESLSELFYYALAVSAWKELQESRWALRVNPSSGNLHPTEGYLLVQAVDGIREHPGIYHYAPKEHGLELRAEVSETAWTTLVSSLPAGAFIVGLSSIIWREAWKYGERAYRYCQHDVGHALAALRISASIQGWRVSVLNALSDDTIARLLGIDHRDQFEAGEVEEPDLLAVILPAGGDLAPGAALPSQAVSAASAGPWRGRPNVLSQDHHSWEIIDLVSTACRHMGASSDENRVISPVGLAASASGAVQNERPVGAGRIVRQRRSALAMDGRTSISRAVFYAMLARTVPALCPMPWDALPWLVSVHLGIFVHRVDGLPRGLYFLFRDAARVEALKPLFLGTPLWRVPPGCPDKLPLFLIEERDVMAAAAGVSCGQSIAGESAFSLGMLAEVEADLERHGPSFYRRLHWESGVIGQVLYLEAEAAGVRSTGIGCFYDDPARQIFGLAEHGLQSLYHFTVGGPVEDRRLTALPAYGKQ